MNLVVTELAPHHDRSDFDCGEPALNQFLQRLARQQSARDFSKSYVACQPDLPQIFGFYTISSGSIDFAHWSPDLRLPRYPVPVARLGRLAVDTRAQGLGIGRVLLSHAVNLALMLSAHIGLYALIVDANGDGIADVILAGRNDTSDQILCILSEGNGYSVMKIEDYGILPDPKTEEHYDEGKKEYGLNTCLGLFRFEKSARNPVFEVKIPQESDSNGNPLNDGAIITYYFENGTFVRESEVL